MRVVLTIAADGIIFLTVVFIPVWAVLTTDGFRRPPDARTYAVLLGCAVILGALLFIPAISIIAVTGLVGIGLAWLSARFALSGLVYSRELRPARLFSGDEATLTIRMANRKVLPLAWADALDRIHGNVIRLNADLSDSLRISGGVHTLEDNTYALHNHTALGPFQELERTYRVDALQRGVYSLGPATITSGDPFGLFERHMEVGGRVELVVYPRVFNLDDIAFPFREAIGSMVTRRALVEDPILIAGAREYHPDDPLRRIHWKATARTGDLQVRVADPSTTAQLMVVLNLNTAQQMWEGVDPDRMEMTISAAASLASWALPHDYPTGLRSNGMMVGAENTPRLAPSAHPSQSVRILEHLARLSFSGRYSAEYILADETRRMGAGTTMVFVTPLLTPPMVSVLTSRKLQGRVTVLYCGRHAAPLIRGVPVHLVHMPENTRAVS